MVLTRGRHSVYAFHIHFLHSADSINTHFCVEIKCQLDATEAFIADLIFVVSVYNKVHSSLCCATSGYLEISGDDSIDLLSRLVLQMKCSEIIRHHPSRVRA
jgi:hypothetical protein